MSSIPYLIQRCTVNGGFKKTQKVSEYLSLDYMGSAEFEFGSIPACLREFNSRMSELTIERLEIVSKRDGMTRVMNVLCLPDQVVIWEEFFKQCANADSEYSGPRLKERISLTNILGGLGAQTHMKDDFWIDIVNCVAICQEKGPLLNFKDCVANSVKFMNEQKKLATGVVKK